MTSVLTQRRHVINSLSSACFAVRNFGMKTVCGQVPIREGWVDVDNAGRPIAVHAELDLARISTASERRDRDLRKPHLLATERFPMLTFTGRAGEPDGDDWQLPGRLAAHGTEIDVVLAASVRRDADRVTVHAVTSFDRADLGIKAPRLLIGRRIAVSIEAVLA